MRLDVLNDAERELAAESFLFRGIPPEELNRRLSDDRCVRAHISRGTVIYDPQAFRRCLGLLLSGQVMVSKRELIVSILEQGELFGAAALLIPGIIMSRRLRPGATATFSFLPRN